MKGLTLLLLVLLMSTACASNSQVFLRPDGQNYECRTSGWHLLAAVVANWDFEKCLKDAKNMGYVEAEKVGTTGILLKDQEPIVLRVIKGTPAEQAGIVYGDKITKIDAKEITNSKDAKILMFGHVGEPIEITVLRDNREKAFRLIRALRNTQEAF